MPKFLSNINTNQNQLNNAVIQPLSAAPSNPKEGQVYYNTSEDNIYRYSGNAWIAHYPAQIPYAQVDSTSTSTAFTATVPGVTELKDGVCVLLKNGIVTSAAGFTININGLGAKPVYSNMAAATADSTIFNSSYTMMFIYDESRVTGGCWICYRGYDSNTNTLGYLLRTNYSSLPMKQITYRYRLFFMSADNLGWVPATTSTSTNATALRDVNQAKINPFGPIVYYGTTTSVSAGSRPDVTYLWQQYPLALGYSFNRTGTALTLTAWKPVYIKCAPQTDGSAIIDATTPYVQDLPTAVDGKIYIFLGIAYNETNVELTYYHPVYEYKNGAIRLWTNSENDSGIIATTNSPYLFRKTGEDNSVGNYSNLKAVVGGTIAFNQLIPIPLTNRSKTADGVTITDNRDGSYSLYTAEGGATGTTGYLSDSVNVISGHKYLLMGCPAGGSTATYDIYVATKVTTIKYDTGGGAICEANSSGAAAVVLARAAKNAVITTPITFKPVLFDLTQMLGSTIADYVYSLETANAGDGVAWVKHLFPADYYAYNAGTLMSVKTSAHKMVGFNQFDKNMSDSISGKYLDSSGNLGTNNQTKVTGYIPVVGGKTYYRSQLFTSSVARYYFWYDTNKNIISGGNPYLAGTITAPINACFIRFSVSSDYWDNFCFNLHLDGERDGDYEPYKEWNYALDSDLELRGIPQLDADNKLYYDGDTYSPNGTVTRRYGIVDLGSLTWGNATAAGTSSCENPPSDIKLYTTKANGICLGLIATSYTDRQVFDGTIYSPNGSGLNVLKSAFGSLTGAQVKTALSGVYLVYELDTPTTETADPYTELQNVDDWGTEEFIDIRTVPIPVGNETEYIINSQAKLQTLPNLASSDGTYLIKQLNGQMSLMAVTIYNGASH